MNIQYCNEHNKTIHTLRPYINIGMGCGIRTITTHDVMMMYSSTCVTCMCPSHACMNDVVIYHMTIRWALIRICHEVRPLLHRQEYASEMLLPRPGLCSNSSSKVCRLFTTCWYAFFLVSSKRAHACMLPLSIGFRTPSMAALR